MGMLFGAFNGDYDFIGRIIFLLLAGHSSQVVLCENLQ
jgi:hypothetical protein